MQLQNVLSFVNGNHSLKLGADIHHVRSTFIDLSDLSGTFNFASAGDFLAGIPSRFRQTFHGSSTQKNFYTGVFLQHEWQLLPQLLLSYGLRYEYETILRDPNNLVQGSRLAYSPLDSGKLVLRFGGGIFFNRPLLTYHRRFHVGQATTLLRHQPASRSGDGQADDNRATPRVHCHEPSLSRNALRGFASWSGFWCAEYKLFASSRSGI